MITTVEQLRDLLAYHTRVMEYTDSGIWYRDNNISIMKETFTPYLSLDQFAKVWNKLDGGLRNEVALQLDLGWKICNVAMALSASPFTLCIAVARALGETVEIPQ